MPNIIVPPQEASVDRGTSSYVKRVWLNAKRFLPIPLLLCGLLATAALRYDGGLAAEGLHFNAVTMPIEVMGSDGQIVGVSIDVSNAVGVDSMYLVGHALGYHNSPALWEGTIERDDKASYRVNGGTWRPISNANANVRFPERIYLGIGGAYHTIRMTVPVSNIASGANTIEFRFNGTEGVSLGYRILKLDLLGPGGVSRIGNTTFVEDDPETWDAPIGYDSASDIAAGQQWWTQRNTLRASPLPDSPTIVASCSDCHAYSGFDLKYFNFSNTSIIERSEFHGLTEEQGNQIAAYIRQVELGRADGRETSPYARPWNPPYQPGVGLTDRGEEDWAAGAGYEAVLDSDDDIPQFMFPDVAGNVPNANPSRDDMRRAMHVGSFTGSDEEAWGNRLDYQNLPIAIQYPDWNNWLPDIHPFEAFGFDDFTGNELWGFHDQLYDRLDTQGERNNEIATFRSWLTTTSNGQGGINEALSRFDLTIDQFTPDVSLDIDYATDPSAYHIARMSFVSWETIKMWEVLNKYKLQNLAHDMWGGLITPEPWRDAGSPLRLVGSRTEDDAPFFWPGPNSLIFNVAPHKNVDNSVGTQFPSEGPYGPPGTALLQQYFSTAWYDLQLVTSRGMAGMQSSNGARPIDWSYQVSLLSNLEDSSGISNWWRRLRTKTFAIQTHNNYWLMRTTGAGGIGCNCSQHPRESSFYKVFGVNASPDGTVWHGMDTENEELAKAAAEEYLNETYEFRVTIPIEEWPRTEDNYEPDTYTPTLYPGSSFYFDQSTWANNTYRLLPFLQTWGTRESLLSDIAEWGELMWPNGNWEQWFSTAGDPPVTTITAPSNGQVFFAPATISVEADVLPGDAAVDRVEFFRDGDLVGTDETPPYRTTLSNVGVGAYMLTAIAFDTDGLQGPSIPVNITVEVPSVMPPTVTLTRPFNGQVFVAPATFNFLAEATPGDAPIVRVEFYSGETLVHTDTSEPYGGVLFGVDVGTYVLSAKAIDENDAEGVSAPVAVSVVEETGDNSQFIPLLPGWNLTSTYIDPEDPGLAAVLAEILEYVTWVLDGDGNQFIPGSGINEIGAWRVGEGYRIFVTDAVTLEIVGLPLDPVATPIQLGEGWNQSAYLRNSPMPTPEALGSISEQLVFVKDWLGRVYIPELDIDQIGDMHPGQGYKIYVSGAGILRYPANDGGVSPSQQLASFSSGEQLVLGSKEPTQNRRAFRATTLVDVSPPTSFVYGGFTTGNTATLVVELPDGLEGYLVGVRTGAGEIVGEAVIRDERAIVSVLGEDLLDPDGGNGASLGEELDVFIRGSDGQEMEQFTLVEPFDLLQEIAISTPLLYQEDGLWLASMQVVGTENEGGDDGEEIPGIPELTATNYPNPFSQTTTIVYSLDIAADVELKVVDVLGRLVATLVSKTQEPGTYQTVFNPAELASGIYFYHLRARDQVHTGRMILAR